jgi:hypothetical protein
MNDSLIITPTANKKAQFIDNIKKWVLLDSQIKAVNEKIKKIKEIKENLTAEIIEYAVENHIDHKKIEISDGELRFYEKKEYQPLSYHFLEEHLGKIIKNKDQIDQIIEFLRENREITSYIDIRRIVTKSDL